MKKKVLIVLKIIFFILMIGSLIGLISWKNDKKEIESILEETNTMIKKEEINGEVVYSYSDQYEFYNDDTVTPVKDQEKYQMQEIGLTYMLFYQKKK